MPKGRQLKPLVLNDDARLELQAIANSRSMPHSIVMRAKIGDYQERCPLVALLSAPNKSYSMMAMPLFGLGD